MAYTGEGTKENPYIVDNWADFETVIVEQCYVKWADSDNRICDLSEITFTKPIRIHAKSIDFNEWSLINLNNFEYTSTDKSNHILFSLYGTQEFKNVSISGNTIGATLFYFNRVDSSIYGTPNTYTQFTNIYVNIINTKDTMYIIKDSDSADWVDVDKCVRFNKSIFKITQNYVETVDDTQSFYFGGEVWYNNCEIEIDLSNTLNKKDIKLFTLYGSGCCYFRNCYIHGNIGNYSTIFPINVQQNNKLWNCIIDFTTLCENLYIGDFTIPFTNNEGSGSDTYSAFSEYGLSLFVINDKPVNYLGDNWTTSAILITKDELCDYKTVSERINQSSTVGYTKSFNIIEDNNIRYNKFGNGCVYKFYDDEIWTFHSNPLVNGGYPFLPFSKYPNVKHSYEAIDKSIMFNSENNYKAMYIGNKPIYSVRLNGYQLYEPSDWKSIRPYTVYQNDFPIPYGISYEKINEVDTRYYSTKIADNKHINTDIITNNTDTSKLVWWKTKDDNYYTGLGLYERCYNKADYRIIKSKISNDIKPCYPGKRGCLSFGTVRELHINPDWLNDNKEWTICLYNYFTTDSMGSHNPLIYKITTERVLSSGQIIYPVLFMSCKDQETNINESATTKHYKLPYSVVKDDKYYMEYYWRYISLVCKNDKLTLYIDGYECCDDRDKKLGSLDISDNRVNSLNQVTVLSEHIISAQIGTIHEDSMYSWTQYMRHITIHSKALTPEEIRKLMEETFET